MKWMSMVFLSLLLSVAHVAFALPESINVNTASVQELAEALDGVGESRARAIIEYREQFGPFVDLEDLQEVSGIGPSLIEANKERIVFAN